MSAERSAASRRIHIIDVLRGMNIIYMIVYHLLYDLGFLWNIAWAKEAIYSLGSGNLFGASVFILLSGICVCFSHAPAVRGARLLAIAGGFTLVTAFIFPGSAYYFGALHLISISMLMYSVIGDFLKRIPPVIQLVVFGLLFALTFGVQYGYFGIEGIFTVPLPEVLLHNSNLYPFGVVTGGFSSIDYFPVLPWMFLFLCGAALGTILTRREIPKWMYFNIKPFSFIGRHSLAIYILHQPVMCAILYIIFYFAK